MIRLQFERLERKLSQARLGALAHLTHSTISLIESGTWNPSADQLAALGSVLGIDPPELLLQEIVLPTSRPRQIEARLEAAR